MLDTLAIRSEGSLSADERDYMETLTLLVEDYDRKNEPLDLSGLTPIDVLHHLMEENDLSTSDLGRILGSKGVASEILNGKRSLSKTHMMVLAERFNVDVSAFFSAPPKASKIRRRAGSSFRKASLNKTTSLTAR
ncbi:MAG TPA: hypothetical protein VFW23_12605 [Tepidisphaeraceae bacterium]|nr:hypothetical protein [Tepidisphaeraceae bacterium]